MYEQLQLNHALYSISESHLKQFQHIAIKYTFDNDAMLPLSLNALDNHAVALNIWCMFKEEELKIVFLPEKMMTYACNYFCLGLLRNDEKIKQFIQGRKMTEDIYFVLSYYLSYATLNWVYELMQEHEQGDAHIQANMKRDYFLFAEQENLFDDESHDFYENQKFVTHLLASDSAQTDRYANYINEALILTKNYLLKNPAFTV